MGVQNRQCRGKQHASAVMAVGTVAGSRGGSAAAQGTVAGAKGGSAAAQGTVAGARGGSAAAQGTVAGARGGSATAQGTVAGARGGSAAAQGTVAGARGGSAAAQGTVAGARGGSAAAQGTVAGSRGGSAAAQGTVAGARGGSATAQGTVAGARGGSAAAQGTVAGARGGSAAAQGTVAGARGGSAAAQGTVAGSRGGSAAAQGTVAGARGGSAAAQGTVAGSRGGSAAAQGTVAGARGGSAAAQGTVAGARGGSAAAQGTVAGARGGSAAAQGTVAGARGGSAAAQGTVAGARGGSAAAQGTVAGARGGSATAQGTVAGARGGSAAAQGTVAGARGGSAAAQGTVAGARGGSATAQGTVAGARGGSAAAQGTAPSQGKLGTLTGVYIHPAPSQGKLGTLTGVYIPCVQNILGIIFYIRLSWIVGIAGVSGSLMVVAVTCASTFITALSLSAVVTNGAMKGGGPYYLIGRALGPEVGVSIGLCFFFGNAIGGSLYILGAVETLLDAMPQMALFPPQAMTVTVQAAVNATEAAINGTMAAAPVAAETVLSVSRHDMQAYGIITTICLCLIVFGGVHLVDRVGSLFIIPAVLAVISVFIGIFLSPDNESPAGLTGLSTTTLFANWLPSYQTTNSNGIPDPNGSFYWGFNQLLGLFYPGVTGIMAGSNRSEALRDTQRSIPTGTLAAIVSMTGLYVVSILLFGAVATRDLLVTDRLLTATIAWPVPAVVQVGIVLSTLGAALQNLMGAPRLLAAIANDNVLPVLNAFKAESHQEPHLATLFTLLLCCSFVLIGDVDYVSPVITMFFLLCYCGVNLSCALLDLVDAPSWRPRWRWHHWLVSLAGALLCLVIMYLISWFFTLVCLTLAVLIYIYVSMVGKAGDWGDGVKSAYMQLALRSLHFLGVSQVHPKNWYPIPLILCKPWGLLPPDAPCHARLGDFAKCMRKKGRGMSIFVSVLEGNYSTLASEASRSARCLLAYIDSNQCEGVAEVMVASSVRRGVGIALQSMGLAGLKPNIVCFRYPEAWQQQESSHIPATFVSLINDSNTAGKACVIVKGLDEWPAEGCGQYGTIDLFWIVRDGGIMLLLSQLLRSRPTFDACKIQVFCIAEDDGTAETLQLDVAQFLHDLRMQADVVVVTMRAWEDVVGDEDGPEAELARQGAMEAFTR
ncbi:unnamed protein product, partial [Closterium sp. Naga37s-1]